MTQQRVNEMFAQMLHELGNAELYRSADPDESKYVLVSKQWQGELLVDIPQDVFDMVDDVYIDDLVHGLLKAAKGFFGNRMIPPALVARFKNYDGTYTSAEVGPEQCGYWAELAHAIPFASPAHQFVEDNQDELDMCELIAYDYEKINLENFVKEDK